MIRNCKNGDWFAFFPILRGKSAFFRYFVLAMNGIPPQAENPNWAARARISSASIRSCTIV